MSLKCLRLKYCKANNFDISGIGMHNAGQSRLTSESIVAVDIFALNLVWGIFLMATCGEHGFINLEQEQTSEGKNYSHYPIITNLEVKDRTEEGISYHYHHIWNKYITLFNGTSRVYIFSFCAIKWWSIRTCLHRYFSPEWLHYCHTTGERRYGLPVCTLRAPFFPLIFSLYFVPVLYNPFSFSLHDQLGEKSIKRWQ